VICGDAFFLHGLLTVTLHVDGIEISLASGAGEANRQMSLGCISWSSIEDAGEGVGEKKLSHNLVHVTHHGHR